jgi:DNA-binding FrmR family transcriptional regulator
MREQTTRELERRLRFIEGQARGIARMVADGRSEGDVLIQLLAVQSAAGAAAELVLRERMAKDIKAKLALAILNCVGPCELCDSVEEVTKAIEDVDYGALVGSAIKTR